MSQCSTWRPTGGPECLGSVQLLSVESFSEDDQTPATFPRPFVPQRMGCRNNPYAGGPDEKSTSTGCSAPVTVAPGPSLHNGQMPAAQIPYRPDPMLAGSGCHRLFLGQIPLDATIIYQVLGPTTDEPDAQQLLEEIDRLREERSTWRQRWEEEHRQLAMFKALIKSQSNPNLLDDPPSSTPSSPGSSKSSESHQSGPTSSGSLAAHPLPFYGEQCLPSPSSAVGVVSSAISA